MVTIDVLNEDVIRDLATKTSIPLVFKKIIANWSLCGWDLEEWTSLFSEKEIPFRCFKKCVISNEPCWERQCKIQKMTFKSFVAKLPSTDEWMYFDYKYLHQWFNNDSEICKDFNWKQFGFPNKGPTDTSLWIGSNGAHTPAHRDTYGFNIVAQVHGRKRWIFFPPDTEGLKPTRVPYEESSVYSEINFYCPPDLSVFQGLSGCRVVELSAGDALVVPRGWWHYVQNLDPVNISMNVWIPHEKDKSTLVSEALVKILVAQICKDLPLETAKLLINPNEDDISDTPLAVLFLQLETVAKAYLDERRKTRRAKRQRTEEAAVGSDVSEADLKSILDDKTNGIEYAPSVTKDDLIGLIKGNLREYAGEAPPDEVDGAENQLRLTKAIIDAFSQRNVIEVVKQNLFARISDF